MSDSPRRRVVVAAAALAAIALFVGILRLPMSDDAYVILSYARTLVESGTWGMFPGHVANTATSPLNVLATAAAGAATGSYVRAAHVLLALSLWTVFLCADGVGRRLLGSRWLGALAVVAVGTGPLFLSSIGLEGPLVAALIALTLAAIVSQRWRLCGIAMGLLVLARMDAALLVVIVLASAKWTGAPRLRVSAWTVAVTLPWFLFSWIKLGSAIPESYFLKTMQDWGPGRSFTDGPMLYWHTYPLAAAASAVPLLFAPFAFVGPRPVRVAATILASYAAVTFLAYAVLRPPPYPWYFLQQTTPGALLGALGIAVAANRVGAIALAAGAVPAALLAWMLASPDYPRTEPFIHTNWASPARYAEVARDIDSLTTDGDAIDLPGGEIGTLAFHSNRYFVNEFSDQARTSWVIRTSGYGRPEPFATLRRWNVMWRDSTALYAETKWRLVQTVVWDDSAPVAGRDWDAHSRWAPHTRLTLERVR